ncbi:MAG: DUF444 family protein [bacterium]|nr:DUF444 family protein [bacterium]
MNEFVPTSRVADAGPAWDLRRRGIADSNRHDKRVKEAIRKNLRDLIAEESIITSDGNKRIRIPIRYLEQYRFKYGQPQQGVGQGPGQPGDVLGRRGGNGNAPGEGQPGDQTGEQTYEVNVPIEELTQMMLEDLALPWLEQKPERQIVSETLEFTDLRKKGAISNLAKRETLKANALRNAARGQPGIHDLHEADLRFRTWDINYHRHSNAAVYLLMDRSGSMTTSKKYIAKSFFFWMVRFLKIKYQHVDIVFIAHDTEAKIVPEQDFFTLSNSGGTRCSSAYQVALEHIQQFHPVSRWNTYLFHFSDGDNLPYDNDVCKNIVTQLLTFCAMVGYGEIRYRDDASFYGWMGPGTSPYLSSLQNKLKEIIHPRFMIGTISNKTEVYGVLESFLGKPKITT